MKYILLLLIFPTLLFSQQQVSSDSIDFVYWTENDTTKIEFGTGERWLDNGFDIPFFISSNGFGLGSNYLFKISERGAYIGIGTKFHWMNGDNEAQFYSFRPVNDEDKIIIPFEIFTKIRMWRNSLSNNLRPWVGIGTGPIIGIYIDGPKSEFHSSPQWGPHWFIMMGFDFGEPNSKYTGMSIRYEVIKFGLDLGKKQQYDNFQVAFHLGL